MLRVEVLNTVDRRLVRQTKALVRRLSRDHPQVDGQLNVVFADDRLLRQLNRRFRRRNRPTDVLAFPIGEIEPGTRTRVIGDVVVSRERARRQGREYGLGYYAEVGRLVLHGILHLLGLTHRRMEAYYRHYGV